MPNLTTLKSYDLACNALVINGVSVGGFGEEGSIEYEAASSIWEDTVGADGEVVVSKLNDPRLYVTITLMESSRSYRDLALMRDTQAAVKGQAVGYGYAHIDQINGDTVISGQAMFLDYTNPNKAKTVGEREFRLLLPYSADAVKAGLLNLV